MPANKNALIRYKTIDNCLRNRYRKWTLEDLVDACCQALYEMEGLSKGVSVRTVQNDIQMMRADKLGYNAPIEVYDHKYYRYADEDYSITHMPFSNNEFEMMKEAVDMLRELEDFSQFQEMADVISRLQDKLSIVEANRKPIIHFDSVPDLKGLQWLNPLYNHIAHEQTLQIVYHPFLRRRSFKITIFPYLLKEFRNRWFLYGSRCGDLKLYILALDRIREVEAVSIPFQANPEFDTDHFFDDLVGVTKGIGDKPEIIRFWASKEQSYYIKTKPFHRSQVLLEQQKDGSCLFQVTVIVNYELISVLLSYGSGIRILSPHSVVRLMQLQIDRLQQLYGFL